MRFLAAHAQHIGGRDTQQDSFGLAPGNTLAIVCDGMGGMEFGDEASRIAVAAFLEASALGDPVEPVPAMLERCAREANSRVLDFARGLQLVGGVGTTLVAAAFGQGGFHYISIGDSGVFLHSGGRLRELNRPHVFANYLAQAVAAGRLSQQAAKSHPERESLTSFIGAQDLHEIDQSQEPIPLASGDTLLLASDGLFKTLPLARMEACLTGYPPEWPELLVEQVLACRLVYQDNVTVVSVTAEDESAPLERVPRPHRESAGPPPLPS